MTPKLVLLAAAVFLAGCTSQKVTREDAAPQSLQSFDASRIAAMQISTAFLKAHMKNGNLFVFETWKSDPNGNSISGIGPPDAPGGPCRVHATRSRV